MSALEARRWPCPHCGESIPVVAQDCRFCKRLTGWNPAVEAGTVEAQTMINRHRRRLVEADTGDGEMVTEAIEPPEGREQAPRRPTAQAKAFPSLGELIEALEAQERFEASARRNLEILYEQVALVTSRSQEHEINHSEWVLSERLNATPGYDRLVLYCNREWGESPSASNLKRVRGSLSSKLRLGLTEANALSVQAVASLLADSVSPATTPQTKPEEKREEEDRPTADMFRAYWAAENGSRQKEIAKHRGVSQAKVSRDIRRVREWKAAGNGVPGLDELPRPVARPQAFSVDPHKMGRLTEDDCVDTEKDE
jgi:hypothetical protein